MPGIVAHLIDPASERQAGIGQHLVLHIRTEDVYLLSGGAPEGLVWCMSLGCAPLALPGACCALLRHLELRNRPAHWHVPALLKALILTIGNLFSSDVQELAFQQRYLEVYKTWAGILEFRHRIQIADKTDAGRALKINRHITYNGDEVKRSLHCEL